VECRFDFTNGSFEKPRSVGLMKAGLWPVVPDQSEKWGGARPAQSAGKMFS